ncbi:MAG: radical SAM protein [Pseudobdellovibrionaceae bacterium]
MELRRYKDIVAFKQTEGTKPFAFHARNLELAEISEEAWSELIDPNASQKSEASEELLSWEQELNADIKSGKTDVEVRSLTLNVTQICNLKCTYCAAGGDGTYGSPQTRINVEKTLPQLKFFIESIPTGGTFKINFLGGEPLLYPAGIQELANYVRLVSDERKIQAQFTIVTNGTLLTEKNVSLLKQLKANVTISLDGPPAVNDIMRPAKDGSSSTALTVEGIKKLTSNKSSLGIISINGVFNKDNLNLLEAYEFYKTLNVDVYGFTYSVEERDHESNSSFIEQIELIAAKAFTEGGEAELRKISFFNQYFSALDNQQQVENFCGAGKSFLVVDSKNNLFTCPWDVGNNAEQVGTGTSLHHERLQKYSEPLIEKNNCHECWARYLCGGGCMYIHKKSTGSKNIKDDQFCSRTRSLISTAILYYKLSRVTC